MTSDRDFDTEQGGIQRLVWEANKLTGNMASHLAMSTLQRRFKANFGATLEVAYKLWCLLDVNNCGPKGGKVTHMLWTLMFLKVYSSHDVLAGRCKCHPDTHRKWVWLFLEKMSSLDIVSQLLLSFLFFCLFF